MRYRRFAGRFWMKPDIRIEASACLLGAASILIVPLRWLLGAVAAAVVHEMGHLLALKGMGVPIRGMRIGFGGAKIETGPMTRWEELIAAAAGPGAGLVLVLFARWIPCCAVCAAVQTAFNLLPWGEQDGKRILRCVAGEKVCKVCEMVVAARLVFWMVKLGEIGVWMAACVAAAVVHRKFACKYRP